MTSYSSTSQRGRFGWPLVAWVAGAHVAVIAVLLLLLAIRPKAPELEKVMDVSLVDLPGDPAPGDTPLPPAPQPPAETAAPEPPPPEPTPPPRERQPDPPPPRETPRPTPPPEPQVRREVKPPPPEPQKPAWKPNTVDNLRSRLENAETVKERPRPTPTPPAPAPPVERVQPRQPTQYQQRSVSHNNSELENFQSRVQAPTTPANPGGGAAASEYHHIIQATLYRLWNEPSRAELNGQSQTVPITITVSRDGTVTAKQIVRRSGHPAMDASVGALLNRLQRMPKFPDGMNQSSITVTVNMQVLAR